jgi:SPP1 family predicted phage head-tail adaptor
MNPGKLNRRIVIQVRTLTKDSTGGRIQTWTDSATVWAEIVLQRGTSSIIADAERIQDTRQFRIRHRAIAAETNRILYQSKFYDITGITEEGIKNTMILDTVATKGIA